MSETLTSTVQMEAIELPSVREILADFGIDLDELLDPKEGMIARAGWN